MIESLIFAMIAGFSIAAPLGMNGVICIKFSLEKGFIAGLVSGLGESTVIGFYSWLIIYSSVAVESFLSKNKLLFSLVSGMILLLMGIKCFFSHARLKKTQLNKQCSVLKHSLVRFLSIYIFAISVALGNPMTIFSLLAFISSSFHIINNFLIVPTVLGFFLGSALWWFILSASMSYFRTKINRFSFRFVNYSSGIFLVLIGLKSIFS